jgi:SAM-dependent methyltransferase
MAAETENALEINRAFSRQSFSYDENDRANPLLCDMRQVTYDHVNRFLKSNSSILELNAGTGIDALHFIRQGHRVLATDFSDGMAAQINLKKDIYRLGNELIVRQLSYENLNQLETNEKFDFIFSNFGGLNCISDLKRVTTHLPSLLKPGAYVCVVIMPPVCPWEIAGIFKGNFKNAFRRFRKHGTIAHLEGSYFRTYYHSLRSVKDAFGKTFAFIGSEGLAALTPPPHHANFPDTFPYLYSLLKKADAKVRRSYPFNRWADHVIATFQYKGNA